MAVHLSRIFRFLELLLLNLLFSALVAFVFGVLWQAGLLIERDVNIAFFAAFVFSWLRFVIPASIEAC